MPKVEVFLAVEVTNDDKSVDRYSLSGEIENSEEPVKLATVTALDLLKKVRNKMKGKT